MKTLFFAALVTFAALAHNAAYGTEVAGARFVDRVVRSCSDPALFKRFKTEATNRSSLTCTRIITQ
jgi:hypothetical protein